MCIPSEIVTEGKESAKNVTKEMKNNERLQMMND